MATPKQVANLFLKLSDPEIGDILSNLKLQKLVYYAQGFHLAIFDQPLFDEDIIAWEHGPVIASLYHDYKQHGSNAVPQPEELDAHFSSEQIDMLEEVYEVYGQFSAWKLRHMTHDEDPWKHTERGRVIDKELMKKYFSTQIQLDSE